MEKNINSKVVNFNMIKKIFSLFILSLMFMTFANAGNFISNQNEAGTIATNSDKANTFQYTISATDNDNITINNFTFSYDVRADLVLTDSMFFTYDVNNINETLKIYTQWGNEGDFTIQEYEVTFDSLGTSYFAFTPEFEGEQLLLYIDYPDSDGVFIENFNFARVEAGLYTIVLGLVNIIIELLEINIGIWKIMYYLFLLSILISVIFVIITLILKLIEFAEKFSKKRKKAYGGGN